ncbi:MAG: hypothetical protein V9E94_16325 [Microthrixaceae bacterium]
MVGSHIVDILLSRGDSVRRDRQPPHR